MGEDRGKRIGAIGHCRGTGELRGKGKGGGGGKRGVSAYGAR